MGWREQRENLLSPRPFPDIQYLALRGTGTLQARTESNWSGPEKYR